MGIFFFLICIYLAVPGLSCDVGSGIWFSDQGSNPGRTLHCKHRVLATGPLGSPIWGFILPECVREGLTEVVILEERGRISRSLNGRVGKAGAGGMVKMFQGRKWQIKRQRGKIKKAKRNKRSQVKKKKKKDHGSSGKAPETDMSGNALTEPILWVLFWEVSIIAFFFKASI